MPAQTTDPSAEMACQIVRYHWAGGPPQYRPPPGSEQNYLVNARNIPPVRQEIDGLMQKRHLLGIEKESSGIGPWHFRYWPCARIIIQPLVSPVYSYPRLICMNGGDHFMTDGTHPFSQLFRADSFHTIGETTIHSP